MRNLISHGGWYRKARTVYINAHTYADIIGNASTVGICLQITHLYESFRYHIHLYTFPQDYIHSNTAMGYDLLFQKNNCINYIQFHKFFDYIIF